MSLTVETGSIVSGANSYISVADYETWIDARNVAHANHGDSAAVEANILRSMDFFEALSFKGFKKTQAQPLQFPRYSLVIDGYVQESDSIPAEVKNALYELTYADERGYGPYDVVARATKSERIEGAIAVEYMDNASSDVIVPSIWACLRKLVLPQNRVVRM